MTTLTLDLSDDAIRHLVILAKSEGKTLDQYVVDLLNGYVFLYKNHLPWIEFDEKPHPFHSRIAESSDEKRDKTSRVSSQGEFKFTEELIKT